MELCECGCGEKVTKEGNRFIVGHSPGMFGKHHSEEAKKKMRDLKIGKSHPWQLGKHLSEETKKKLSESLKGKNHPMFGKLRSEETKRKMSESKRGEKCYSFGKHFSEETKKKMREAHLGRHHSEETKKKIGDVHRGKRGKLATNWKGGISFELYPQDWTYILKESIRCRDKYTCRMCFKPQINKAFDVHHIDYNKKNCDPKNLITLCRSCHMKTNYKREDWIEHFRKLDSMFE